ncbi:MAG: sigma-54-dependent Fis family transcriptional regulator [Treponematales bacterium]
MEEAGILIIDDEQGIRAALAPALEDEGYRVFAAGDAAEGLAILRDKAAGENPVGLVFLDVLLPRMGGMEALEKIRGGAEGEAADAPDAPEVVMISGHANVDMAVRAVKLGAFDFLEKPLSLDRVLTVSRNALAMRRLRAENRDLRRKAAPPEKEIIGTSAAIEEVRTLIRQAAASDARILITGENGSGKELVALAVHKQSARAAGPFVEVNCAAIPDTLIESELFGHERGAFTGAVARRKGRFEMAHRGTLFLDEIGDMSLQAQAKVLRAIQEQTIERVGGEKTLTVDTRILAATNHDLGQACASGRFRQDLFFRLNVIQIHVPPLRERREDIPLLLSRFLAEFAGDNAPVLDEEALEAVSAYNWPGNVRELRNFAERAAVMCRGPLGQRQVKGLLRGFSSDGAAPGTSDGSESGAGFALPLEKIPGMGYNEAKEFFEKAYLEFQFSKNHAIISKTAEAIGMYPSNLHAKLRKYHIAAGEGKACRN